MSDDEDDPVVQEVDVFLSKQLSDHLYLFQYPVRPVNMKYDDIPHLCARVKPVQQKVEMELVLDTRSPNYERSKGEQIAINVDGTGDQAAANYYTGDRMDKQVLTSVKSGLSDGRFVVGCLKDGELHVTPLKGILQLRPSFVYLDRGDSKQESTGAGGEDSQDEEEEAKPITVRFARKDEDKERSTSYKHVTKKLEDEPWVHVVHHQTVDPASERERLLLVAQHGNDVSEFHVAPKQYLEKLVTKVEEEETQKPPLPSNVLSMTELRTMTLGDQIRALMMNAKVMRFTQLMALLTKGTDPTSALRCLQQVALMVQGCWVVKSDVLYPRDSLSPHSGVRIIAASQRSCGKAPAETLCRARDYVMWRFTQNRIVIRKDISTVVKVPAEEVKEILEQMARLKINKGWEFVFEYDQEFVNRHPEVVQRQLMLWDAKFQQLSKTLKISKADMDRKAKSDELAAACSSPEKPKRRRTISRSRTKSTSAGSGMSDLSDNEVESSAKERSRRPSGQSRSRRNSGRGELPTKADVPPPGAAPMSTTTTTTPETTPTPIFNGAQNVILNNSDITTPPPPSPSQHQQPPPCASTVPSVPLQSASAKEPGAASAQGQGDDLRREVNTFIRDKLTSRFVLSQSDVKTLFNMQLASLPPGHILGSGVSEKMLEQALFEEGGVLLTSHTEPVYVLGKVDDGHGEIRDILLDLLKVKTTVKTTLFKQRMEEAFGELPPDATWRKVLREYCVSKSGQWALKCTVDNKL